MTTTRTMRSALAALALASVASCGDGRGVTDNGASSPLLRDPMADVQLAGATRVERTVTEPSSASFASKPVQAAVRQVYRITDTGKPGATLVADLVRRARTSG